VHAHLLAGSLSTGASRGGVVDPATASTFCEYATADAAVVDTAVDAARSAAASWAASPIRRRQALLHELADVLDANARSLAALLTREQGKPLAESSTEIATAAAVLRHYGSLQSASDRHLFQSEADTHRRHYTPLGVVAGIIPWNFPVLIAAMKIGPALLTGNAIIVKPAPTTPATTLEFGRLVSEKVPPGLLQILGDDGTVGPLLVAHAGVAKVSFTGSTQTGRNVMRTGASGLKRLTLELGGNDPAIVLADAAVEEAAERIYSAAFYNAGQVCGAVKRVYVEESVSERFCARLAAMVRDAKVGPGTAEGVTIGPVQNAAQHAVAKRLADGAERDGVIVARGAAPEGPGYFIAPTVFGGLSPAAPLVVEEQFSPLLPVLPFRTETEAVEQANATPYGLTASVWSSDLQHAREVAERIDAALVCVNKHNAVPLTTGLSMAKSSGVGWLLGEEGVKEYLQAHVIAW
jgi:acyl-CoA reductase-like NAD-dependent aldehyde dehydrogenase